MNFRKGSGMMTEPSESLDGQSFQSVWTKLRAAREKIVLLVSHEDDALTGAEVRLQ